MAVTALDASGFRDVLDRVAEPVVVADGGMIVRYLNAAAQRALGVDGGSAPGRPLASLVPGGYGGDTPEAGEGWRIERLSGGWAAYGPAPGAQGGEEAAAREAEGSQLAALEQLAEGVAQEIGSPLTAINVAVEYLLRSEAVREGGLSRDLEMILAQTRRMARLARSLVELARPGDVRLAPADLNRIAREAFALLERQLRRNGVETELDLEAELPPVPGDADQLQQVVMNLLLNAQRAVLAEGAAEARIEVRTRPVPGAVELVVADRGAGISPEDLPRVFLPFFSRAGGAGLGLSHARSIVHRHRGALRAESPPGGGAVFTLRLPREADERRA